MKIKCFLAQLVLMIFALFYFPTSAEAQKLKLSERDKIKILKILLSERPFEPENYRTEENQILFSKANIPPSFQKSFPKKLDGYKTHLLSKKEIYPGFVFVYHTFGKFKVKGNSVLVDVYRRSKYSEYGAGYKFRKIKGRWKSKLIVLYGKDID